MNNYAIISSDYDDSLTEIPWGEYVDSLILPYMIEKECVVLTIYNKYEVLFVELDHCEMTDVLHESGCKVLTEEMLETFFSDDSERDTQEEEYFDNKQDEERLNSKC